MRYERWLRVTAAAGGYAAMHRVGMDCSDNIECSDGSTVFRCQFDAPMLAEISALEGVTILPGLNAPADRLRPELLAWFASEGVSAEPGDTVLNLLRRLRDAKGGRFLIDAPS